MKLQKKITLSIVSLILFFGTLATITTYSLTRNEFSKQLTTNLVDNTYIQSQEVYQILKQSQDISYMLANRPVVRQFFTDQSNKELKSQIEEHYLDGFNMSNRYSAIYLMDNTGVTIFSTDPRFISQNYGTRSYYIQALYGKSSAEINLGLTSNELGYYFSSPIFSLEDQSKVLGVAVVKLNPNAIEESLLEHQKSEYNIMLTDKHGVVVVASDKKKLFSSLGELSPKSIEELRLNNTYGKENFDVLNYDVLQQEINNQSISQKTIKITDEVDNEEEIVSISKIKDFPLYIVFEGNFELISQISLRTSLVIAAFVAVAAILSVFVITFVLRFFMQKQQKDENEIVQRTKELESLNKLMIGRELKMIDLKKQLINKNTT